MAPPRSSPLPPFTSASSTGDTQEEEKDRKLVDGEGGKVWAKETNHRTAKKPVPLLIIQYSIRILNCSFVRMDQFGEYSKNQCGIEVKNLTPEDSGTWQCEVYDLFMYRRATLYPLEIAVDFLKSP
jgi:hypothetical protein